VAEAAELVVILDPVVMQTTDKEEIQLQIPVAVVLARVEKMIQESPVDLLQQAETAEESVFLVRVPMESAVVRDRLAEVQQHLAGQLAAAAILAAAVVAQCGHSLMAAPRDLPMLGVLVE
jgi:hypothetical protein